MKKIENDINGNERLQFSGKLVSISDSSLENSNGKNYKVCTVNFESASGKKVNATAFCYEGNYGHADCVANGGMQIGQEYLCTVTLTDYNGKPSPIINVSHLTGADRPSIDMFDFGQAEVMQEEVAHEFTTSKK